MSQKITKSPQARKYILIENQRLRVAAYCRVSTCQRRCDFVVFRRTWNVEKWRVNVYSY